MTIAYMVVKRNKQPVKCCRWLPIYFRMKDAVQACTQYSGYEVIRVIIHPTLLNYHMLKKSAELRAINIHPGWPVRKKRRARGI
jgi:hypothetical protein